MSIEADRTGVIRQNTKLCFPSDNSIIRIDRYNFVQMMMGETQIFKDNFVFGIREKPHVFQAKVEGDDYLRNRDAK
jgi:hypothetical protein